jgi:hypothetical protein
MHRQIKSKARVARRLDPKTCGTLSAMGMSSQNGLPRKAFLEMLGCSTIVDKKSKESATEVLQSGVYQHNPEAWDNPEHIT